MAFQIDHFYLFNGYMQETKDGKGLEPRPNGLDILTNTIVFTKTSRSEEKFVPWVTNERGIFYLQRNTFAARTTRQILHKKMLFQMIPENSLPLLWAAKGEAWSEKVNEFFKKNGLEGIEFNLTTVQKRHLRIPENTDSQEYRTWYSKLSPTEPMLGFIIPKVRSIEVTFSSEDYKDTVVQIISPLGERTGKLIVQPLQGLNGLLGVSFFGDKKKFPEGLYKIEVTLSKTAPIGPRFKSKGSYVFYEKVLFSVNTLVSEQAIIVADGISLEETVLNQFPLLFENQIAAGKAKATAKETEIKSDFPEPPVALEKWVNRTKWIQAKTKFSIKLYNYKGAKPLILGIADSVISANLGLLGTELRKGFDLSYGVYGKVGEWKKTIRELSDDPAILKRAKKILAKDLGNVLDQNRWFEYLRSAYVESPKDYFAKLDIEAMGDRGREIFLKAGIPKEVTNFQKAFGKTAKTVEKAFIVADTAYSYIEAGLAVNEVIGTKAKLQLTTDTFNDLIHQYKEKLSDLPNRDGIGKLEKYRAMTVTGAMDVDVKTAEACGKAMDALLDTLAVIPGPQQFVAELVILIKGTASLGVEALADIDGWLCNHYFSSAAGRHSMVSEIMKSSYANQALLAAQAKTGGLEGGVQFRLRAEAINGLVGLLTRAAIASKNETEYLQKIKEYRVKEYIETYVLNDGWQMPLYPAIPLSMDTVWLFTINPFGLFSDFDFFKSQFGFTKPLTLALASGLPGMGMLVSGNVLLSNHVKTHFHDSFPIHRMDSMNTEVFAKGFRPHPGKELGVETIAYTRIYRRSKDAKANDAWVPYEPKEGKDIKSLSALSPLDQIRVLVVLKKGIEPGIYPISLQLIRTDGYNVKGPVYKDIIRNLDTFLLPEENEWKGRLGCVFYPFYQLGYQTLPGIKPLAASGIEMLGVGAYYAFGGLWNMTYGFQIWLSGDDSRQWLKLGGKPEKRNELDSFPVDMRVHNRPEERKLLITDFLKSNTSEFSYPHLFQSGLGFGPSYLKVADAWYWIGNNSKKEFPHFDWHQPVEIIVTFWTNFLSTDAYKKAGLDWGHTPIQLTLHEASLGIDTKGPTFSSQLTYLGRYHTSKPEPQKLGVIEPMGKNIGDQLSPLLNSLRTNSEKDKLWFDSEIDKLPLLATGSQKGTYHLFAAHIPFSYFAPDKLPTKSIRPFAKSMPKENDFYEYYFSCASPTGINNLENGARMLFKAPKMDGSTSPWNPREPKIIHWIEKECEKTDASPEVI